MKKGNRTVVLGFCIVSLGLLAGCNNPKKPSADTDKSSASTKVTTELTASSKETKVTKETTVPTPEQSSTAQETKETEESHEQTKEEVPKVMDLAQIQQGDYSSLNGTWGNGLGNTIFIENNTMSFTDISNQKQPAEIIGQNVDIPLLNSPDGTPELVSYMGDSNKVKAYEQQLGLEANQGFVSLRSNLPGAVIYVSFLPKGVMGDILEGDNNQDKIVAVGTQNTATSVRATYVYYKID